jgi:hypothetical protein
MTRSTTLFYKDYYLLSIDDETSVLYVNTSNSSSTWQVALSSGFLTSALAMKSMNSGVHLSVSFSLGGGLLGIIKIARIGCTLDSGGSPSANCQISNSNRKQVML